RPIQPGGVEPINASNAIAGHARGQARRAQLRIGRQVVPEQQLVVVAPAVVEAANVAVGINEPLDLGLVILLAAGRVRDIRFWIELLEGAANRVERARWKRGGKGV